MRRHDLSNNKTKKKSFVTFENWILCDLTIKSDTGRHSQFLRCLSNNPVLSLLTSEARLGRKYPKNFWRRWFWCHWHPVKQKMLPSNSDQKKRIFFKTCVNGLNVYSTKRYHGISYHNVLEIIKIPKRQALKQSYSSLSSLHYVEEVRRTTWLIIW